MHFSVWGLGGQKIVSGLLEGGHEPVDHPPGSATALSVNHKPRWTYWFSTYIHRPRAGGGTSPLSPFRP